MKFFLVALAFASFFTNAYSAEIVILEETTSSYGGRFTYGDFGVNKGLGRAWVNLNFAPEFPQSPGRTESIKVPDMKYDNTTKEVIIDSENGRVVCAYEKRGLFGIKTIKATKDCLFKESFSTVTIDDGFHTRKVLKRTITLTY